MPIVRKTFVITSANGSLMYNEGMEVPTDVARAYPQFMEGAPVDAVRPHDPTLPEKLTKAAAEKLSVHRMEAWISQYHPMQAPADKLSKDALITLIMELQEQ